MILQKGRNKFRMPRDFYELVCARVMIEGYWHALAHVANNRLEYSPLLGIPTTFTVFRPTGRPPRVVFNCPAKRRLKIEIRFTTVHTR